MIRWIATWSDRTLPTQQGDHDLNPLETAMKRSYLRIPLIFTALGTAMATASAAAASAAAASVATATTATAKPDWTFDGAIHNNSLAVSPDETIAVPSYS